MSVCEWERVPACVEGGGDLAIIKIKYMYLQKYYQ
jgi:hypothetical protein